MTVFVPTFLLQLSKEDHVRCGYHWIGICNKILGRVCKGLEPLHCNSSEDLSNNAKERNATVILAVTHVTIRLIQCDDVGVFQVLWHVAFSPAAAKDFVQLSEKGPFAPLQDFSRNAVFSGGLAGGKGILTEFTWGGFRVQILQ